MGTFSESIAIKAATADVWAALADIGSIHRWNPGVVDSWLTTSGDVKLGSGRRCELGGKNYLDEEVVRWTPMQALTMRIVGTNLPFRSADIRFTLEDHGGETQVTVSPVYALKFGILGRVLDSLFVRRQYRRGMVNLLQGLKQNVESAA